MQAFFNIYFQSSDFLIKNEFSEKYEFLQKNISTKVLQIYNVLLQRV